MTNVVRTSKVTQPAIYSAALRIFFNHRPRVNTTEDRRTILYLNLVCSPVQPIQHVGNGQRGLQNLTRQAMHVRHIEARSCNHCCSKKATSITQPVCAFVALGIQHAMRMSHIMWPAPVYNLCASSM
jgi:hypothetical protein